ncbi:MAG: helix-hairpin-helix domain-containing protein [Dysgonamonadaceae bacterium]|jgi:DNA uptake protein ComE-like DNA-binding protein|nr:helix-hairpin-helix domain-containing protein [Dysgonamonadaceae bacterium]
MSWKDFFYFSRRERQGILLLLVFIAGIFAGKWIFSPAKLQPLDRPELPEKTVSQTTVSPKSSELSVDAPVYNYDRQRYNNRKPEEKKRTYYTQEKEPTVRSGNAGRPSTEKFTEGTVIELNEADTTALMHIPGIGPSFAKRITGYRNILGGYYRIEQLQEVYGMYEELYTKIIPYLKVNPATVIRLPINSASLDKLKAHPYLNFYQAKAIVELRKKKGRLTGVEDLQLLEEFTPEDRIRLTPYLEF